MIGGIVKSQYLLDHTPVWALWVLGFCMIWPWMEVATMLLNQRRRAVHDFIAGTVVIHEPRVRAAKHDA